MRNYWRCKGWMRHVLSYRSKGIIWRHWSVWKGGLCYDSTSLVQIVRKSGQLVRQLVSSTYRLFCVCLYNFHFFLSLFSIKFIDPSLPLNKSFSFTGEMCNLLAMTYLQQEDYNLVLELLKKAEILTEKDAAARAATFNNFACYYRRQGKLHAALQYLQKVSKFHHQIPPLSLSIHSLQTLYLPYHTMIHSGPEN